MSSTIRWEQDADGVVTLTLDDPSSSANTMNDAYVRSMGETVDRLEREKESIRGVVLTSAKKTFFAGGNLGSLIRATPDTRDEVLATGDPGEEPAAPAGDPRPPGRRGRSTAPRSAAAWRSRWPATTASSSTTRRSSSASPRSPSACCPAAAGSSGRSGCSA